MASTLVSLSRKFFEQCYCHFAAVRLTPQGVFTRVIFPFSAFEQQLGLIGRKEIPAPSVDCQPENFVRHLWRINQRADRRATGSVANRLIWR